MPYQPNKPLANDQLSQSQVDINGNFQILGAIGGGNGVNNSAGINVIPGAGFNYVYLPVNAANPPAGTVFAGNNAIYSFLNPTSNQNSVYINQNTFAGATQVPATASILGTATPANNSFGWTYLPSGILMKWGFVAYNTGGTSQVLLNGVGGPNFNAVFNVQATPQHNGLAQTIPFGTSVLVAGAFPNFVLTIGAQTVSIAVSNYYWFAIGR